MTCLKVYLETLLYVHLCLFRGGGLLIVFDS